MNKLRALCVGLAVLLSGVLASCNSPEPSGPQQWAGVVKVHLDGSFSNVLGAVLIPTNPSLLNASMAYIYCQVNQPALATGQFSITLLKTPQDIDGRSHLAERPGAVGDVAGNAALYDLRVDGSGPVFFDAQTLLLPVSFFIKNQLDATALQAEVALHTFPLVGYTSSIAPGDTELKLYLRHAVAGDVSTPRDKGVWLYRAYSLSAALQMFQINSGNEKPSRIVIHYDQNMQSDRLGEGFSTERQIEVLYNF